MQQCRIRHTQAHTHNRVDTSSHTARRVQHHKSYVNQTLTHTRTETWHTSARGGHTPACCTHARAQCTQRSVSQILTEIPVGESVIVVVVVVIIVVVVVIALLLLKPTTIFCCRSEDIGAAGRQPLRHCSVDNHVLHKS